MQAALCCRQGSVAGRALLQAGLCCGLCCICTFALASASVFALLYLRVLHIGEEIRCDSAVTWHEFARSVSPEEIIWVPLRVIEQALRDIPDKRPRCIYVQQHLLHQFFALLY